MAELETPVAASALGAPWLLALGPAVVMGFARFAYALVLPAMKADLHWSYRAAGAMNTANAAGYLLGAIVTPLAVARWGERRLFLIGLWGTALLLLVSGATAIFAVLCLLRFALGVTGALVFISALALAVSNRGNLPAATAALICTGGIGAGIALSGGTLPFLLSVTGREGWRLAWVAMGIVSLLLALLVSRPVSQLGEETATAAIPWNRLSVFRPLWAGLTAYLLLGAGYITYMTFMIAYVRRQDSGAGLSALVWLLLGLATLLWPLVWRRPIQHWPGGLALAATTALVLAGTALPLLSSARPAILLSALLMGGSFTPVAAITTLTRRSVPPELFSLGVALMTVLFAAGQTVGPYVSGALSDRYGLSAGLMESAIVLLAAVGVALLQREPKSQRA